MKAGLSGAKLGIFIFIGSALLVIGIFMLGNKEALFKPTFIVKAYFHNIEGLRNGAPVKLSGIDAGAVQNIHVVGDTVSLIEVSMRLLMKLVILFESIHKQKFKLKDLLEINMFR